MGTHYRWVIVTAGGLLGCVGIGALYTLPVFLRPISGETGWSITGVSAAMTVAFIAMAVGSLAWGNLSDRWGPRMVVVAGSFILSAGLALAARATSLLQFQLIFGLLVGSGAAAITAPMMACVTGWFDARRSLAVSLVSAGMGMSPLTVSPLAAWLVQHHDWRASLLTIAGLAAALMIPTALLVRPPPARGGNGALEGDGVASDMSIAQALKSSPVIILMLTNFTCCVSHSGPIFHTVSYAMTCGIPLQAAVTIYSVEGLAGLLGRIGFGLLSDRYGAKRILVTGLLVQAFAALAYLFVHKLGPFYLVAALMGFVYSGVLPLYVVLLRENYPLRMMGTLIGGTVMASGLGMAIGPLVGGMVYDALGSYTWLYIGSWAIGLGAVLIALKFRPAPECQHAPLLARPVRL